MGKTQDPCRCSSHSHMPALDTSCINRLACFPYAFLISVDFGAILHRPTFNGPDEGHCGSREVRVRGVGACSCRFRAVGSWIAKTRGIAVKHALTRMCVMGV